MMFVLMWATLLLSVKDSCTDTGASLETRSVCQGAYCITLSDGIIRAEAGLCVVVPCSFTTSTYFYPKSVDWFKCGRYQQRCQESDIIFSNDSRKVQSGFRGRVKQLEPNISQNNCSIIINDLTASDSGSYQLRVNGYNYYWNPERFQYSAKTVISVEDLTQKPTLTVPPLTEGQQTTLSCTAPGLCSGSAPEIIWMWSGGGGQHESTITGKIKTENLSAFEQRHSSTLTFTPAAEDHGTNVTCLVRFNNVTSTGETVTLSMTSIPSILNSSVCEVQSEVLTCVCISQGFPIPTIEWPLLKKQTHYSFTISMTNTTVNTSISLSVKDHNYTTVRCVSRNEFGEVKEELKVVTKNVLEQKDAYSNGPTSVLPWAVAAVSLIVNVVLVICVVCLWTKRKTVDPNKEDRTYMSLQKTDRSPEYDVICQPLN
ncbi:sialic acid-binding Ig-like lectin 14 [Halichoeres trimaculatus]|uniref:sialic acid-binding Ig-like lectin 14 n=1 Tax=Halichoeres trimaculatus TaxID=147232 RepID=UPI003D9EB7AC